MQAPATRSCRWRISKRPTSGSSRWRSFFSTSSTLSRTARSSRSTRSVSVPKLDPLTVGVTLVLLAAMGLFLQRTRTGVQMRAAAEDFRMARILGVRANTVIATAFAISGLLAGVGAYLLTAQTGEVAP